MPSVSVHVFRIENDMEAPDFWLRMYLLKQYYTNVLGFKNELKPLSELKEIV